MTRATVVQRVKIAGHVLLAILALIFAMSTGMYGCGPVCYLFTAASWIFLAFAAYGVWRLLRSRNSRHSPP